MADIVVYCLILVLISTARGIFIKSLNDNNKWLWQQSCINCGYRIMKQDFAE